MLETNYKFLLTVDSINVFRHVFITFSRVPCKQIIFRLHSSKAKLLKQSKMKLLLLLLLFLLFTLDVQGHNEEIIPCYNYHRSCVAGLEHCMQSQVCVLEWWIGFLLAFVLLAKITIVYALHFSFRSKKHWVSILVLVVMLLITSIIFIVFLVKLIDHDELQHIPRN